MIYGGLNEKGGVMNNKKIPVEQWSRTVGYFRPVSQWNLGKKAEFEDRKMFKVKKIIERLPDVQTKPD